MIDIKYELSVGMDEQLFSITVRELSPVDKKKIEQIAEENNAFMEQATAERKKIEELNIAIKENETIFKINEELLKEVNIVDKISLFLENKKLSATLARLEKEKLHAPVPNFIKVSEGVEQIYKEKFNMAVSGAGKEELLKIAEQNNISFERVWGEINKEMEIAFKKKSLALSDGQDK